MPGNGRTRRGIPEKYASQAYRMGINYIIYAMTH